VGQIGLCLYSTAMGAASSRARSDSPAIRYIPERIPTEADAASGRG
jgi:hypothetical protein